MPDWLIALMTALIGGLTGAGGLAAWQRARSDARLAVAVQRDDYTLRLKEALDKDETAFRQAVYEAYLAEVGRNKELDSRLTEVQKQLTIAITERDIFQRQLERAQTDLQAAHEKIRHLEAQIAALEQKEHV